MQSISRTFLWPTDTERPSIELLGLKVEGGVAPIGGEEMRMSDNDLNAGVRSTIMDVTSAFHTERDESC